MALQREPMKEIEAYAKENNINHENLLGTVKEYIKQLRAEVASKQEKILPSELKYTIEIFHGDIQYIQERLEHKGYFVVTHDKEDGYTAVAFDDTQGGYKLTVKDDFPELEEAIDYVQKLVPHDLPEKPAHHELSQLKVLYVKNVGFHVGRERYDAHLQQWFPFSWITSKPMENRTDAEYDLEQVREFRKYITNQTTGNLKVLVKAFHEEIPADPSNEFRRNAVIDELRVNHHLKPHVIAELIR